MGWYDLLMRLPIVSLNVWFAWREFNGLRGFVIAHPSFDDDWSFITALLARLGILVFLCLLVFFHASRRRPLRKYPQWRPRIDAFLGMTLIYPILLLPHAQSNLLLDAVASLLLLAGSTLCLVAVSSLGRSLSVMPEARKLVTDGLYARIRHPLYMAEFVAQGGVFLQYRSVAAAALLAVVAYFQVRRMDWEEAILAAAFPDYVAYRQRSWRLLPGVY